MRFDTLIQFIVPLTFVAIWALTSLFNREAQPLPSRSTGRPVPPDLPKPPARPMAPRGPEAPPREPPMRWGPSTSEAANRPAVRRTSTKLDDDVLIIRSEPTTTPQRLSVEAPRRRSARPRPGTSPAPSRPEPTPIQSALSQSLVRDSPLLNTRPLEIDQLALPPTITNAHTVGPAAATTAASRPAAVFALTGANFLNLVGSSSRLREAVLLSELLQPPLALRPRRNRRYN